MNRVRRSYRRFRRLKAEIQPGDDGIYCEESAATVCRVYTLVKRVSFCRIRPSLTLAAHAYITQSKNEHAEQSFGIEWWWKNTAEM